MMGKKWLTFDLDGTLMQNPFGKWVFPEINETYAAATDHRDIVKDMVQEFKRRNDAKRYRESYDWDDILDTVCADGGLVNELNIVELVKKHAIPPKVYLLEEGIADILGELLAQGFALGVITNGFSCYQLPVLEALGISDVFQKIVAPDIVGSAKPDPRIGDDYMENGSLIAHIGDRVDHDISFANRLGVPSILIDREMTEALKAMAPEARAQNDAYLKRCREKWERGTGSRPQDACDYTPTAAIHTLKELADLECLQDVLAQNM